MATISVRIKHVYSVVPLDDHPASSITFPPDLKPLLEKAILPPLEDISLATPGLAVS
jgi:hypothetical protein